MAITKIEIALANIHKDYQEDDSPTVVEPVVLAKDDLVNKEIVSLVYRDYREAILACTNYEEFKKLLNAIAGVLGLNLNEEITDLARIANGIRELRNLEIL